MSTSKVWFRPPTPRDLEVVARTMRPDDVTEVRMANEPSPLGALEHGVSLSHWAGTVMWGSTPLAVTGVVPVGGLISSTGKGSPWFLGSTMLYKHPRVLLEDFPRVIYAMLQRFPVLENYAYEGSKTNLKWLRHVGFKVYPAAPVPGYRGRYHRFMMGD